MDSSILTFFGIILFFTGIILLFSPLKLKIKDDHALYSLVLSLILIPLGTYFIFVSIPWYVIVRKFIGLVILFLGYFLIFMFPGEKDYQEPHFTMPGIIIGVFFFILGFYLLIF